MTEKARLAVIDQNTLAAIGLKQILNDIMPIAEVDIYGSFGEMTDNRYAYAHCFISSRIYFEHANYFRNNPMRPIILVAGDMQIAGFATINVCQSEQTLAKSVLHIMHRGHHGNSKAPSPFITPDNSTALSPREAEVAALLARGMINKEIADRLNISVTTVVSHRKSIMDKLNARSLADITIHCVLNGLVDIAEI